MKSDYRMRAAKLCRLLDHYIASCRTETDFSRAVTAFNLMHHRHVIFEHGISRAVFITSDYVIKIDAWESTFGGCKDEYMVYQQAKKDGYEYLFAEITPFCYNNHMFFIMPRIKVSGMTKEYSIDEYLNWDEWTYLSQHVDDLHDGNWGMKNNRVVVFDYACRNTYYDEDE